MKLCWIWNKSQPHSKFIFQHTLGWHGDSLHMDGVFMWSCTGRSEGCHRDTPASTATLCLGRWCPEEQYSFYSFLKSSMYWSFHWKWFCFQHHARLSSLVLYRAKLMLSFVSHWVSCHGVKIYKSSRHPDHTQRILAWTRYQFVVASGAYVPLEYFCFDRTVWLNFTIK